MDLAGRCSVGGDCGCRHDTVDLWLLTTLQDLAVASYSCVIAIASWLQSFGPMEMLAAHTCGFVVPILCTHLHTC